MEFTDDLTRHYSNILDGTYDCIDRIVLNAHCPMLLTGGGIRYWFRKLKGSDKDLDTNQLIKFAGRFSRRIQSFCESRKIPLIYFSTGERKHEEAEKLIPEDSTFEGIFAVFVSRAPGLLWEVKKFETGSIDIRRKEKSSLINHYYFHIIDKDWGHICIKICCHPPFTCSIMLNGHEWVEREKHIKELNITKEGNCFTSYSDGNKLSEIADTLKDKGQLEAVCNRWVYRCLWFAMDYDEQKQVEFKYSYSIYQIEYSRNLLFHRGRQLDDVYQNIIDLTRSNIDIKRLKTIFGRKNRPFKHKTRINGPEVRIETPDYNMTIFKIHFGKITLKLYDKGERTLRAEVVVHNTKDLKCKRGVDSFSIIVDKLHVIMNSFMNNIDYAHLGLIDDGSLNQISMPSQRGKTRLAGIDITKERSLSVMETVLELSFSPMGYTSNDVAEIMRSKFSSTYSNRQASYDIKKLRGKGFVDKQEGSAKYITTQSGIQKIVALLSLIKSQIPKNLSIVNNIGIDNGPKNLSEIENYYFNIQSEIINICKYYGISKAA